jgi:hypothetical protein
MHVNFVFRRHFGNKVLKNYFEGQWICEVIAPKLYKREFHCERVMSAKNMSFWALYWATLFAIKQEKFVLSDKNISSDWESKEWLNLQYR